MRRNFADVLRESGVDFKREFARIHELFYGNLGSGYSGTSMRDYINSHFLNLSLRGRCLSLDDFDQAYGFDFAAVPDNPDADQLIDFCEYVFNLLNMAYSATFNDFGYQELMRRIYQQIYMVTDKMGYEQAAQDGFTVFVPADAAAVAVAEILPRDIAVIVAAALAALIVCSDVDLPNLFFSFLGGGMGGSANR